MCNCEQCQYFHVRYDVDNDQEIEAPWCDIWGMLDVPEREQCAEFLET